MDKVILEWNKLTPLNKESVNSITHDLAGVFRLSYRHEDTNIYVFFVGRSDSVKKNLLNLLDSPENECIKFHLETKKECFFKYAPVADEKVRELVYKQLYKFYQPSCNEQMQISEDVIQINMS